MKCRNMAILGAAICAATFCYCSNSPAADQFTAKALIHLDWKEPTILNAAAKEYSEKEFKMYKDTQAVRVKSRGVATAALRDRADLLKLPAVAAHLGDVNIRQWVGKIIKVEFPDDAELMTVSCTLDDPKSPTALVNAVVNAYMAEVVDEEKTAKQQRFDRLDRAAAELAQELRDRKRQMRELEPAHPGGAGKAQPPERPSVDYEMLEFEVKLLEQELREFRMELARMRIELSAPPRVRIVELAEEPFEKD